MLCRGKETGRWHLERMGFIIAKHKHEMEVAVNKEKHLEHENQVREKIGKELDGETARKHDKANRENGNAIISGAVRLFGMGKYADLEKENDALKKQLTVLMGKMNAMEMKHRSLLGQSIERQKELETVINKQQTEINNIRMVIEEKDNLIARLDRLAYPQRYRLSSGAELDRIFVPNYHNLSLHIWTKVGDKFFDDTKYSISHDIAQRHFRGELTDEEFVNAVFEPHEQVNEAQRQLLGATLMLASGGPAQAHVGTGSSGPRSDLPWGEKKKPVPRR